MADEKNSSRKDPIQRHSADKLPADKSPEKSSDKSHGKLPSKDITPFLKGWDFEPGTINVRKISGIDGRPKLQMRLDLGLLQMELSGRPDGTRPNGYESLLEYYEAQLSDYKRRHGTEMGFALTSDQCQSLREEAAMYYQRYLSLFVLEDFPGVVRDTARNLRVLDICNKFAEDEQDRLFLEQYRPYITMMNARATASTLLQEGRTNDALKHVREAMDNIKNFFEDFGQPEAYAQSNEVRVLKRLARDIKRKIPIDPVTKLQNQLERAVKAERYEEAAKLRDEIKRKSGAA
jgi:tetratricopeptide (TPR) repeat protein